MKHAFYSSFFLVFYYFFSNLGCVERYGFNSYLSHNTFTPTIAQDFSEFGVSASIRTSRQDSFNHGWRPFGTVGLAINNHHNLGASVSLGISKIVEGKDSLDVVLNYSNGVGVVSEPIYGVNVRYRF